jgi:hypothetical protein
MLRKGKEYGPEDVLKVIDDLSEDEDRLGFVMNTAEIIKMVNLMLNSWNQVLFSSIIANATLDEIKSTFIFVKDLAVSMVEATEALHQSALPKKVPEEVGEEKNKLMVV